MPSATRRSLTLVFAAVAALAMTGAALPDVHLLCAKEDKTYHWAMVSVEKLTADLPSLFPSSVELEATGVGDDSNCLVVGGETNLSLVFLTNSDKQIEMKLKLETPPGGVWSCSSIEIYIGAQGMAKKWTETNAEELQLGGNSTVGSKCFVTKKLPLKTSWGDSSTNSLKLTNFKLHPNVESWPFKEREPQYEEKCAAALPPPGFPWWGIALIVFALIVVVAGCAGGLYYFIKVRGNEV